jgi:hypothetical protein
MPQDELIIEGKSTSGLFAEAPTKTLRVKLYQDKAGRDGWEVHLGIGGPDPDEPAKAAMRVEPAEAVEAAETILEFAERASIAKDEAS